MEEEQVVLVDRLDNALGTMPKMQAHRDGRLHRAISVFIYNDAGQLLLQKRAEGKYHSPGLWTNACCSHPRPNEQPHAAALRRLNEEMGIECPLEYAFSFLYRAELEGGLVEHELDHVFVGNTEAVPAPDPDEVGGWRWTSPAEIERELATDPSRFTAWFPIAFEQLTQRRHAV